MQYTRLCDTHTARHAAWALAILLTAACSPRTTTRETVVERVTVRDTVYTPQPAAPRHPLDPLIDSTLARHATLARTATPAILVTEGTRTLCALRPSARMRTASVMKLVTAVTALHTTRQHPDSAFVTTAIADGSRLLLRGGYDPLLDDQSLDTLARRILAAAQGTPAAGPAARVHPLLAGQDTTRHGSGWCWDDRNPLLTPLFYAPLTQLRKRHPIAHPEQDCTEAFAKALARARRGSKATAPASSGRNTATPGSGTTTPGSGRNATAPGERGGSADGTPRATYARHLDHVLQPCLQNSDNLMAEAIWRITGPTREAREAALREVLNLATESRPRFTDSCSRSTDSRSHPTDSRSRPTPENPVTAAADHGSAAATGHGDTASGATTATGTGTAGAGNGAAGTWPLSITQADGSGLSLYNYASAEALVALLAWADTQPWSGRLRKALAEMGASGTLKSRRIRGAKVYAKTGTVDGVITLAGYLVVPTDSGDERCTADGDTREDGRNTSDGRDAATPDITRTTDGRGAATPDIARTTDGRGATAPDIARTTDGRGATAPRVRTLSFAIMWNGVDDKAEARAATDTLLQLIADSLKKKQ